MGESGIRVLIYAGDQDYICNWLGNQAWTQALPWSHQGDFNTTSATNWTGTSGTATMGTWFRVTNQRLHLQCSMLGLQTSCKCTKRHRVIKWNASINICIK